MSKHYTEAEWEWIEKAIAGQKAIDKHYADTVNKAFDDTTAAYIDAGIPEAAAKKLAAKAVEKVLYDIQTELGGW